MQKQNLYPKGTSKGDENFTVESTYMQGKEKYYYHIVINSYITYHEKRVNR